MPQLSPMSWVFVFGVLLIFLLLFMISVWWMAGSEYKIIVISKVGVEEKNVGVLKWGFGKKFWLLKK
uniref:ATP synthase F0 subunit 8 n=1 Tax=Uniomerus tetralasmus TaxID=55831 RepID=A0A3B8GZ33_9BIVA|nr:TPA_asm: ATP synthase F0 subunit 8 [Uniomerus tetralasmus]